MYQKGRSSQNYGNARNSNSQISGSCPSSAYNTRGNYQASQSASHQQSNYKQGNVQQNLPGLKSQQQQQQPQQQQQSAQNTPASTPTRPLALTKQQSTPQQGTVQIQQQVQQQMQQQQQVQQQSSQQQQQQPPPQQVPLPQRLKPILKQSVAPLVSITTPPQQPKPVVVQPALPPPPPMAASTSITIKPDIDGIDMAENVNVELQEQPRWRRKTPGFKVNKKLKRLRMNQRLRKTLQPKNAIMVLNEMKAGCQFTFPETPGHVSNSLYLVHAELDGKTYVGQGLSKPLARQAAAENALKALLLEKMTAASMKARMDAESDGQANSSSDAIKEENDDVAMETTTNEDEIPWSSLASFALYKLFLEWHNQGTSVPVTRPGLPAVKGIKKEIGSPRTPTQKELPPNPTNIHPVMLLNQMRPGLTYVEVNRLGNPPNTMFTLSVDVNGVNYTGTAKNKKDAKKAAAKAALLALYGLTYPEDVPKENMIVD